MSDLDTVSSLAFLAALILYGFNIRAKSKRLQDTFLTLLAISIAAALLKLANLIF